MDEKKVLVVDDDRFFRELLKDALQDRYQVFEATSGEEAIKMMPDIRPDLIILDIEMPGRSGIDVCRELKASEQTKTTPIILVTSRTKRSEIVLGLQAGADDYLTKPLYLPEVLARIDTHLNATRYYSGLEYRDLMMLLELTNSISAVRNPMKILQMIVARMSLVIEVARCSIVGMDSNGELVVKASTDLGNDSEIRLEMSRYPEIRAALETRQAIALNDFQNDPLMAPVRQYVSGLSFQSIIVVPIIKKATAIGTLFLRTASSHKGGITDRVYNLCHLVANISANALENASLFESMKTAQEYLEEMAIRDGLTRLFTHQNFYERLDEEFSRALRHQQPLSLIFFDIDNFKRVNDTYGHTRGDEVLRKIGRVVREVIRESDIPARYGGEEFAVLLPNTPAEGAMEMTSRMCAIIRELRFDFMNDQHVTISAGVSTFSPNELQSFEQLVRLADRAMYQAKTEGKDRVVAATDPSLLDQPSWKSTPNP